MRKDGAAEAVLFQAFILGHVAEFIEWQEANRLSDKDGELTTSGFEVAANARLHEYQFMGAE